MSSAKTFGLPNLPMLVKPKDWVSVKIVLYINDAGRYEKVILPKKGDTYMYKYIVAEYNDIA